MKVESVLFFTLPFALLLSQCAEPVSSADTAAEKGMKKATHDAYAPLTLRQEGSSVKVVNGAKTVSTCTSKLPNVEKFKFVKNKSQVVVKSRGNHGPAVVELFDSLSGVRRARVMAYEISNGQPDWAVGMAD
ncbi:hypothetical protein SAMN02745181_3868 [Rubritalea squalenifaciens DSM 18772]|uniref:Uncharacterized protein n=1 Tax=Rubritalea squalenifaciens DSM 18772 TaxID=1123071 RepID=A0A1M6SR17_9BACT|nr:hypothetical protein [Rubritalea squalenifaciens]SHK47135.1 hypothetical protein SAMN02745181_3868 [Rubritalea squalenifaciens DSM 18772]